MVEKLKRKGKNSYDFLTKAGEGFKNVFFEFCKRIHTEEIFPTRFDKTTLIQIYKGKGPAQELGSFRFIHMKEWAARLTESLVVEGLKDTVLKAGTKFQLGGKPGMRVQYHLFVIKSSSVR